MAITDTFTGSILDGIAQLLAGSGFATYIPPGSSSVYAASDTGIVFGTLPQSPARCIALAYYPVAETVATQTGTHGVQIRTRGVDQDPNDCDQLADNCHKVLHGLTMVGLNSITAGLIWHQSGASLGQGSDTRWERSDNYYLLADRPSNALTS